jgi:hypothetical protein
VVRELSPPGEALRYEEGAGLAREWGRWAGLAEKLRLMSRRRVSILSPA